MIEAENVLAVHPAKEIAMNPWASGVQTLIKHIENGNYEPIPTGVENFDRILGGGFISQQLVGISGRPGAGKTAFGQWLSESMALNRDDFSAVYFCFEMSQEQLQARSISRVLHSLGKDLTPLDVLKGKDGWRYGAEIYAKMYADKVLYMGMGSGLDAKEGTSLDELERKFSDCVEYNKSIGKPAPIFVCDYLQIVRVAGLDEQKAIGEVMARLKGLAVKHNTVGLVIIANNRQANKKNEEDMFSGRGSSSIEYGLDAMLSLTPNEEEAKTGKEEVEVTLTVTKGRWVKYHAKAVFKFNGEYMSYKPTDSMGEPLTPKEQKVAMDLYNMMENETKLFK